MSPETGGPSPFQRRPTPRPPRRALSPIWVTVSFLAVFLLVYLGVQLGSTLAGGTYAGLIPDTVPTEQRG